MPAHAMSDDDRFSHTTALIIPGIGVVTISTSNHSMHSGSTSLPTQHQPITWLLAANAGSLFINTKRSGHTTSASRLCSLLIPVWSGPTSQLPARGRHIQIIQINSSMESPTYSALIPLQPLQDLTQSRSTSAAGTHVDSAENISAASQVTGTPARIR